MATNPTDAVAAVEGLREDGCERCGRVKSTPGGAEWLPLQQLQREHGPGMPPDDAVIAACDPALCFGLADCAAHAVDWRALYFAAASHVRALGERVEQLERERDARPTEWAYQQACAALDKHRKRADDAESMSLDLDRHLALRSTISRLRLDLAAERASSASWREAYSSAVREYMRVGEILEGNKQAPLENAREAAERVMAALAAARQSRDDLAVEVRSALDGDCELDKVVSLCRAVAEDLAAAKDASGELQERIRGHVELAAAWRGMQPVPQTFVVEMIAALTGAGMGELGTPNTLVDMVNEACAALAAERASVAAKVEAADPIGHCSPRRARDVAEQEAIAPTVSGRSYCPVDLDDNTCCTRPRRHKGDHVVGRKGLIIARWPKA